MYTTAIIIKKTLPCWQMHHSNVSTLRQASLCTDLTDVSYYMHILSVYRMLSHDVCAVSMSPLKRPQRCCVVSAQINTKQIKKQATQTLGHYSTAQWRWVCGWIRASAPRPTLNFHEAAELCSSDNTKPLSPNIWQIPSGVTFFCLCCLFNEYLTVLCTIQPLCWPKAMAPSYDTHVESWLRVPDVRA